MRMNTAKNPLIGGLGIYGQEHSLLSLMQGRTWALVGRCLVSTSELENGPEALVLDFAVQDCGSRSFLLRWKFLVPVLQTRFS